MLFSVEKIQQIVNSAIAEAGISNAVVNGSPLGVLDNQTDIDRFGTRLLSQPNYANPFITTLYQQFIYKETEANIFRSPFDYFRELRDGVAYGTYESNVQPIMPLKYDMKAFDRVLDFWETPVITQYFAINRADTFPQTITKVMLRQAFKSYEEMDSFLSKLILAPRNGNKIIETNQVKMVLNQNLASGVIKKTNFTKPTTQAGWIDLASDIVATAEGMCAEPTTKYNNYENIEGSNGVKAWAQSDRRDIVLIGTTEIIAKLRTHVLAFAMHDEEVGFTFHFIALDNFDYSIYNYETREFGNAITSPLSLLLCDGGYIKLEDNLDEDYTEPNVMTLGLQRALQVQQTIGLRVDRNALAWVESEDETPVINLTDEDGKAVTMVSPDNGEDVTVFVTPKTDDYVLEFTSANAWYHGDTAESVKTLTEAELQASGAGLVIAKSETTGHENEITVTRGNANYATALSIDEQCFILATYSVYPTGHKDLAKQFSAVTGAVFTAGE